jgi:hypothetical protein
LGLLQYQSWWFIFTNRSWRFSGWCVCIMHWTNHVSCSSAKILSIGKIVIPKISYDIDYKSWENCILKCEIEVTLIHLGVRLLLHSKFLVCWVITYCIVRKLFSRRNQSHLSNSNSQKSIQNLEELGFLDLPQNDQWKRRSCSKDHVFRSQIWVWNLQSTKIYGLLSKPRRVDGENCFWDKRNGEEMISKFTSINFY